MNFRKMDRTFVVAEIGVNHEGDLDRAKQMVRLAAESGADAVKFQTYRAENYVSTEQPERLERVRRFQLGYDDFRALADEARDAGVVFFSTPLHATDADFLAEVAPVIKVSSGDLTHLDLVRHVAGLGKPMILSTGAGTYDEIDAAVAAVHETDPTLAPSGRFMLMHCVAAYPPKPEELNLANIASLGERYGVPVGYSDHSLGTKACELAVAMGAVAVEKHFTYRKEDQTFHDHAISADPPEMKALVEAVRQVERLRGSPERRRQSSEEELLPYLRRSLAVGRDIPAGTAITEADLVALRPMWGLPLERRRDVVGAVAARDLRAGELVRAEGLVGDGPGSSEES